MGIYVMTGATTGIGAAAREKFLGDGHEVFNIDYKGGDFTADLSTKEGRQGAIDEIHRRYPQGIDAMICNAGVGPTAPIATIFALNFFASVEMAEGVRDLLKLKSGNCVITSSNSITNQTVRMDWVDMLANVKDEDRVMEFAETIPRQMAPSAYSSSIGIQLLQTGLGQMGTPCIAILGSRFTAHQRRGTGQHHHTHDRQPHHRPNEIRLAHSHSHPLRAL